MDLVAAPQLPDESAPPEAYAGKGDAGISPFFKAIARDLSGSPADAALAVKDLTKKRFARTKLKQLFKLTDTQFEGVLRDAGAEVTWRPMVEEYGGMKFAKVDCPSSALLVRVGEAPAVLAARPQGALVEERENTVSKELGKVQCEMVLIPESMYALIELIDPMVMEVNEVQMGVVTMSVCVWIWCKTGKWNIGAFLLLLLAQQLARRFPKLQSCNGRPRTWLKALTTKSQCYSRKDSAFYVRTPIEVNQSDLCERAIERADSFSWLVVLVPVQGPGEKSYPDILFANPDEHPQVMEPARQTQLPIAASPDADGSAQTVNINGKIFPLATAIVALPLQCPLPANTPQPLQPLPQQLLPPRAPMALAGQGIMAVDDDDDDVDVPVPATVPPDVPVGPQLSAYEKQRLAQISINHAKLRTLGLNPLGSAPLAADKGGEKKSKKRKACGADAPDESASTDASSPDQLLDMQERDKLFNQCTVYEGDGTVPAKALPPLQHTGEAGVGHLVLIPAAKYKRWADAKYPPRDNKAFMGWVGKIVSYTKAGKVNIKVHGDKGFECLAIKGRSAYAVSNLTRLM